VKIKAKSLPKLFIVLLVVASVSSSYYFYKKYDNARKNPNQAQEKETKDLVSKVAKLIAVPDETPTIATVQDKEKLKDQPFFADAQNGDKILIFTAARKAIIYREKENKLINVGPIAVSGDASTNTVKVSVLGSADNADASATTTEKLLSTVTGVSITKDKAKSNYDKTKVYDVSGTNSATLDKIVAATGGEKITALPDGETAPAGSAIVVFSKK
jgi:hypothetical protein